MVEHAVIIDFKYGKGDMDELFAVENLLEAAISEANAGEYDGNEIAVDGSDGTLYMYGPDADRLFDVIEPILREIPFMKGARVQKRYGPPEEDTPVAEFTIE